MTFIPAFSGGSGGSAAPAQLHDTTHSPVGLWQLNGDHTDDGSAGVGLTLGAGVERYGPAAVPGLEAAAFDGATYLEDATVNAAFQLAGAMSLLLLVKPLSQHPAAGYGVVCTGPGEGEPDNILWSQSFGLANNFGGFHETGAGTNVFWGPTPKISIPQGVWSHIGQTRTAGGVNKLYLNGTLVHSAADGVPTGGSTSRVIMGAIDTSGITQFLTGFLSSVMLVASELTGPQMLTQAQRTLPPDVRP